MNSELAEALHKIVNVLSPCSRLPLYDTFGDFTKRQRIEAIADTLAEIREILQTLLANQDA